MEYIALGRTFYRIWTAMVLLVFMGLLTVAFVVALLFLAEDKTVSLGILGMWAAGYHIMAIR
ncbi:MAG: hypothetical protein EOP49_17370 [Sphingobacteriales bacterium]|nr:MAG: hypothetical protein EOP49_17370 [Sphingobacteriales bacterium]